VKKPHATRRDFLQGAGAGLAIGGLGLGNAAAAMAESRSSASDGGATETLTVANLDDGHIILEFDQHMRLRLGHYATAREGRVTLSDWTQPDQLTLATGDTVDDFELQSHTTEAVGKSGPGKRLVLRGRSPQQIEKVVEIELLDRFPGLALCRTTYRNAGQQPLKVRRWTTARLHLAAPHTADPPFWSFCGSTHADRRDWVQPVRTGFSQDNFMGMAASDYGGGTPIVDVWRSDAGLAIGHLEDVPRLISLPLHCDATGATVSMTGAQKHDLSAGEELVIPRTLIAAHRGDYFSVLDSYRRFMTEQGICSPKPPASAYDAVWCAWGYERACTSKLIEDTLPKVRELGLRWAVIDDGWQNNVGDWRLDRGKYPQGEADMQRLVTTIRSHKLLPRLWWAPLAVAPGSDVLHDHPDMLLLDKNGAVQNISWWNCFYLCPAYQPTVDYTVALVRRFIGEWKFAGLKIDGQHLNSVAPCYNPAHHHAHPEESVEKLQDLFLAVYETATKLDPESVVELCPCGTSYSYFNFRAFNQAPASDPESSWQVRHKGKTLKALMGPHAAFAGDHVELSTGGRDFASTVGVGGIVSTKFTWPRDPKPKDSFLLTPEKEALWRKWITLYNERRLPLGTYRGELYDIGFDKPETHVVEKEGSYYYAFYAKQFNGNVPLRGLTAARYRVRDYFNGRELGEVTPTSNILTIQCPGFLVLEAVPV
jgi:alpha-galactosidase